MMKTTGKILWAILLLVPALALAQPGGRTIAIQQDLPLTFGAMIKGPSGGSIVLNPDGTRTMNGVYPFGGSGYGPGVFTVSISSGNPHYSIVLPASATLTGSGGGTMTINDFRSLPSGSGRVNPPARTGELTVGGTLNVGPNQPSGVYNGTYLVVVSLSN